MPDDLPLPVIAREAREANPLAELRANLSPSLRIMLDERLYEQVRRLAQVMAKDTVFTPRHLVGKEAACFTVITQAITWNLDPGFVARATYQTPGGSIGFEGKLVHAILEQSGRFIGAPKFEYVGDWSKVQGKFQKTVGSNGKEYIKPAWTDKDAAGLGIIVRWKAKGEDEPRVWPGEGEPFYLTQCYPLNSPLWASDGKSQITYLAMRRFANLAAPGIFGGMPFEMDDLFDASERARDITPTGEAPPRPTRESVAAGAATITDAEEEPEQELRKPFAVTSLPGDTDHFASPTDACEDWMKCIDFAEKQQGERGLTAVWESNTELYAALDEEGYPDFYEKLRDIYGHRREEAASREAKSQGSKTAEATSAGPTQQGSTMGTTAAAATAQATTAPQDAVARPTQPAGNAKPATPPSGAAGGSGALGTKAGRGRTAATAASPTEQHVPFPDDPAGTVPAGAGATGSGGGRLGLGATRSDIWDKANLAFDPPIDLAGKADWSSYGNRMRDLIEEAPDLQELNRLFADHGRVIEQFMKADSIGFHRMIATMTSKEDELSAALNQAEPA